MLESLTLTWCTCPWLQPHKVVDVGEGDAGTRQGLAQAATAFTDALSAAQGAGGVPASVLAWGAAAGRGQTHWPVDTLSLRVSWLLACMPVIACLFAFLTTCLLDHCIFSTGRVDTLLS
jgi:hypothetical protein